MTIQKFEVPDWIRSVLICDPTDIWGNVVGIGLGELAAVLSPAKKFDRRGDVLFIDDFEDGAAHFSTALVGTGAAVAITSAESNVGGFAAKLTGGSDSSRYAEIFYRTPVSAGLRMGAEIAFRLGSDIQYVVLEFWFYDGVKRHQAGLRYVTADNKWQYGDIYTTWQTLKTGVDLAAEAHHFHPVKLVINTETDKYVRALIAGEQIDMSTYDFYTVADTTEPALLTMIDAYSNSGKNGWMYVDPVIITQNEPA
jgi:hypothetical protein